jgi:transposase InsO family protein
VSHANASLSETGRLRLARLVVDQGWTLARAAERFGVSVTTARRWADRYREHGRAGMADRSSRPKTCPRRTSTRTERRVVGLRVTRRWGPARIAFHLRQQRLAPATVHKILRRYGCPPLAWTDPATGARLRARPKPRRYERAAPGELVHVDIKKLGRIPDGGGHRVLGEQAGKKNRRGVGHGYWFVHNAVDDRTRLAYSELLTDERKDTAAGFWQRANAYFTLAGITVQRVMTDNGACYRSKVFAAALGEDITHKRTRPYRPQTNGKVERFNRTMLTEWAYARPYQSEAERAACFADWLHTYNHHRAHTALGGKSPADLVPNLRGQNT